MPEPDQPEYAEVLPEWIKRYLAESRGRAFVLFTSYRLMVQAAEKVRPFCEEQGWTLYVQGQDMQRHAMLEAFRKDVDSELNERTVSGPGWMCRENLFPTLLSRACRLKCRIIRLWSPVLRVSGNAGGIRFTNIPYL